MNVFLETTLAETRSYVPRFIEKCPACGRTDFSQCQEAFCFMVDDPSVEEGETD